MHALLTATQAHGGTLDLGPRNTEGLVCFGIP